MSTGRLFKIWWNDTKLKRVGESHSLEELSRIDLSAISFFAGRESMKQEILLGIASERNTMQKRAIETSITAIDSNY